MTHTQGPLSVHPYTAAPWQEVGAGAGHGAFRYASIGIGSGRTLVAQVRASKPSEGFPEVDNESELLANAALFIAAPDLLEAVSALAGNAGAICAFEHETRSAVGNTNWQCLMDAIAKADAAIAKAFDTVSVQAALDALRPATPSISKEGV